MPRRLQLDNRFRKLIHEVFSMYYDRENARKANYSYPNEFNIQEHIRPHAHLTLHTGRLCTDLLQLSVLAQTPPVRVQKHLLECDVPLTSTWQLF